MQCISDPTFYDGNQPSGFRKTNAENWNYKYIDNIMKIYKSFSKKFSIVSEPHVPMFNNVQITSSKDAEVFIRPLFGKSIDVYESFFLILLNQANNTIGWAKIGQGGITGTVCDMKIILKYVIELLSPAVFIAHNHPSGVLKPSTSDQDLTMKVRDNLKKIDTRVLDHVILTADSYFSFADNNLI